MKLFELVIDDTMDEIFALSFVSDPAIEEHGTNFHQDKGKIKEIKDRNVTSKLENQLKSLALESSKKKPA